MSKEEDRICAAVYEEYGDEAEMDFEANKEQRPLQIVRRKEVSSLPNLTISSSYASQQNLLYTQHANTMSDAYIITNGQSKEDSSLEQNSHDMPYVITTSNSLSRSGALKIVNANGEIMAQNMSYGGTIMPSQKVSLNYTVSVDSKTVGSEAHAEQSPEKLNATSIVTSAPNLKIVNNEDEA